MLSNTKFPNASILILFFIVGFLVYSNSLFGPFLFDDTHIISENPFVHDLRFFFNIFTDGRMASSLPENSNYRPLTTAIFSLLWNVAIGATWPFHVYKVVLHIFVSWFIFLIAVELMGSTLETGIKRLVAFFSALIFLVHPSESETVNYIASTSTLQSTFFYLSAFWFFLKRKTYLMGISFLASVFTKQEGATFPAIIILHCFFYEDRNLKNYFLKLKKPLFICGLIFAFFLIAYVGLNPKTIHYSDISAYHYFITQIRAWIYYLIWIFTPWGYAIEHLDFGVSQSIFDYRVILSALVTITLLVTTFWLGWRRQGSWKNSRIDPIISFGVWWYFITILPASSIFPLSEVINEHRYYLSYTLLFPALSLLIVVVAQRFILFNVAKLKPLWLGLIVLITIVLSVLTFQENSVWKNAKSLWSRTVEVDSTNGRAHNNLGTVLLAEKRYDEALAHFIRCSELWPSYKYCRLNQYITYKALGKIPESKRAMAEMLRIDNKFVVGQYHYASFLHEIEKKTDQALDVLRQCNQASSNKYVPCLRLYVFILHGENRKKESPKELLDALEILYKIDPKDRVTVFTYGLTLIEFNQLKDAERIFEEAYKFFKNDSQVIYNLAWLSMKIGDLNKSKNRWQETVKLIPDNKDSWLNLREVALKLGDQELVIKCGKELNRINSK